MKTITWLILSSLILLQGCMVTPPSREEPVFRPTYPRMPNLPPATGGAVVQVSLAWGLFDDSRARRVGDVVTIRLEESTSSSKSAGTEMSKDSSTELPNPTLFGNVITGSSDILFNSVESEKDFKGAAKSDQSNRLSGTVTAIVAEVLPNGLMLVQGEKWMNFNRGEEYLRVSGLVRPEDIDAFNSISSLRLADARIAYSGTGELADSNTPGWLTRFFFHPITPF